MAKHNPHPLIAILKLKPSCSCFNLYPTTLTFYNLLWGCYQRSYSSFYSTTNMPTFNQISTPRCQSHPVNSLILKRLPPILDTTSKITSIVIQSYQHWTNPFKQYSNIHLILNRWNPKQSVDQNHDLQIKAHSYHQISCQVQHIDFYKRISDLLLSLPVVKYNPYYWLNSNKIIPFLLSQLQP